MVKRKADGDDIDDERAAKRTRPSTNHLSHLSDELILRVLSFLPVSQLVVCQRLSRKYGALAGDGQLWKVQYYNRFVRPRASRLPGLKEAGAEEMNLHFASKASRWLEEEHLVRRGVKTNWKRQYKLRHNWTKGSCAVNEIQVAQETTLKPMLVQMHEGIIYMADHLDGLRAWSTKGARKMVAQHSFDAVQKQGPPTSLAVDLKLTDGDTSRVVVGFEDGVFGIFSLSLHSNRFALDHSHSPPSSNDIITSVAISWPYVVTMTATQSLSLYRLGNLPEAEDPSQRSDPPRLLHSLKSYTAWPPLATSLRTLSEDIIISVTYAMPTYLSGWTVGIQEVRLSAAGMLLESRTSSEIDQHYRSLAFSVPPMVTHLSSPDTSLATSTTLDLRHIPSKPTSLSYTHPYLLLSHPDNTLTLYLVSSTADSLSVSAGSRLWGHTSSVSGAHVGGRGKAVSISKRGDELRVWELEGGFASSAARKRLASGDLSVRVQPELRNTKQSDPSGQAGLDLVNRSTGIVDSRTKDSPECGEEASELTLTRGWIGFDEENVVVLKEQSQGRQALVVYDFS